MSRPRDTGRQLSDLPNLFEVSVTASHAAFLARSLHLALVYPEVPGQAPVLRRMAELVADRSGEVHRALDTALGEKGEKS